MDTIGQAFDKPVELPQLRSWGDDRWREKAECRGKGNTCFFPSKEQANLMQLMVSESKLMCSRCTVREDCLKFALVNGIHHGVYGGLAPRERVNMTVDKYNCRMSVDTVIRCIRKVKRSYKLPSNGIIKDLAEHLGVSEAASKKLVADAQNQYV